MCVCVYYTFDFIRKSPATNSTIKTGFTPSVPFYIDVCKSTCTRQVSVYHWINSVERVLPPVVGPLFAQR